MQIYRKIHKSEKGYHSVHHQGNNLFSNMWCDTFLPKLNCSFVITKLEKKVTNRNPSFCCLWRRKSPLRKTVTKKILRHFTIFSRMTNISSCSYKRSQNCTILGHWVLLLFRLAQPAAGSCHFRTESKLLWKLICSKIFLKWYRKKILCVFHFSLDVTSFFSPVFERNESPMLNRSQSN